MIRQCLGSPGVPLRTVAWLLLAASAGVSPLGGQAARIRAALLEGHQAYNRGDLRLAAELLSSGLDPAGGPLDSAWVAGVHQLIDCLLNEGKDSLAAIWMRWALRQKPDFPVDSINFAPPVTGVVLAAQKFVLANPQDPAVTLQWRWPAQRGPATMGSVLATANDPSTRFRLQGRGDLATGEVRAVEPGTHVILASAPGKRDAQAVVEVLPGVTTLVEFALRELAPAYLYVASRPWGLVTLDGQRIGYTTVAGYALRLGEHRIRIEREGYLPWDTTVVATREGERLRLGTVILKPVTPR
ncbi:MAG: hypothetical protein KatS3mg081_2637 [Gemmatimonadales bacterium]|nr:MAG: hypothetical protein KatS3mg081_2637 [Gemmatimonadales bacterium]